MSHSGSTNEVGPATVWKHSILPMLSLSSYYLLKRRCPAFKVNNDTYNKVSFPQRLTLLYLAHNHLGTVLEGRSWFSRSGVGLESLHSHKPPRRGCCCCSCWPADHTMVVMFTARRHSAGLFIMQGMRVSYSCTSSSPAPKQPSL